MAAKTIECVVITPEREVLSAAAESVTLPAHDGELGVLAMRAPLMCELGIGQMRVRHDGAVSRVFIDGGFAQVLDNRVTVLTGRALKADEVTPEVLSEARTAVEDAPPASRGRASRRLHAMSSLTSG